MSLTADVATGAAERVEKSAGPAAGLAVWRRLAFNAGGAEIRGRAILGGLRCAISVRDLGAIRDLTQLWQTVEAVDESVWDGLFATCKALWRAGLGVLATELAAAEVRRRATARALYTLARCLDWAGDARAAAAFGDALALAEKEGAVRMARVIRVRRASWLGKSAETMSEAIEEAKKATSPETTLAERLVLARVLLRSPSRFGRASATGLLDEVVGAAEPDPKLVNKALVIAARHADDMGDEITSLEVDRLLALFSREKTAKECARAKEAVRAIDRLARAKEKNSDAELEAALDAAAKNDPEIAALHERARDILRGRFEAPAASATSAHPQWTAMLDAVVAMRDAAWPRTAVALRRLAESSERGERLPPHAWTVAQAALAVDDVEVRAVAGRLAASMMKSTAAAPPRGWLGLAHALAACGMDALATIARRSAAVAREPGAVDALGSALTRSGWQLALSGDRSQAIARLREARALMVPAAASTAARDAGSKEPTPPPATLPDSASIPST